MSRMTINFEYKIDKVFDHMKENKISFADKKGGNSDSTCKSYKEEMHTYNNWLKDNYGITIDRSKPRHAYEYHEKIIKTGSVYSAKRFPHALHAFQSLSKPALGQHIKCGDKRVMLTKMNDAKITRKSSESTGYKASGKDYRAVDCAMASSTSSYAGYAKAVHEIQYKCGLRVSEAVNLKIGNIDFEKGTMTFKGKGGLTRTVEVRDKAFLAKIEKLCAGKKPGADVFRVQNKKGDPPSVETRIANVKREVSKGAEKAGVGTAKASYNTHSGRKAYVSDRVSEQVKKSGKEVKADFHALCKDPRIAKKADKVLENIRKKFKDPTGAKAAARELTTREMNLFIISCEIGHFRLDVMRFYTDY